MLGGKDRAYIDTTSSFRYKQINAIPNSTLMTLYDYFKILRMTLDVTKFIQKISLPEKPVQTNLFAAIRRV